MIAIKNECKTLKKNQFKKPKIKKNYYKKNGK